MKAWLKISGLVSLTLIVWGFSAWLRYQYFEPPELIQWGFGTDASTYWDLASNMLAGRGFVDSPGLGHAFTGYINADYYAPNVARLPAYPLALTVARSLWDAVEVGYVLNVFSFGIILFYAYHLTRYFSFKSQTFWAYVYIVLLAFSPVYLIYLQGIQSDLFSGVMIIAFTYHLLKINYAKTGQEVWIHTIASAVFGSIAILTRANLLVYVGLLLLFEIICVFRHLAWKYLFFVGIVILAIMLGWSFRNYRIADHFKLSNQMGFNLFLNYVYYEVRPTSEIWEWGHHARHEFMDDMIQQGYSAAYAEFELDLQLTSKTVEYNKANWPQTQKTALRAVIGLFIDSYFDIADVFVAKILQVPLKDNHVVQLPHDSHFLGISRRLSSAYRFSLLIAFVLYPVLLSAKRMMRSRLVGLWISSLIFIVATGLVINSGDRLLLPIFPFLVLFLLEIVIFVFEFVKRSIQNRNIVSLT